MEIKISTLYYKEKLLVKVTDNVRNKKVYVLKEWE